VPPKVSVVIPSYNHGTYVERAIRSALHQDVCDLEVVVVDDGSTDDTRQRIVKLDDARLTYIRQENHGLPAARNAGIRASTGELLAFLDADDEFDRTKLARQIAFLENNPEVGLAYNSRLFVDVEKQPLFLDRAPRVVSIEEILAGYPFAPSDVVVRREWAERVGCFDESYVHFSEDLDFHLRLALAGCRFAGVDGALTYRRAHGGRIHPNIEARARAARRAIDLAVSDPRCPDEVRGLRDAAVASRYVTWSYHAGAQGDARLACELMNEAKRLNAAVWAADIRPVLDVWIASSLVEGDAYEERLRRAIETLAPVGPEMAIHADWAVGRGYLLLGARDVIWGRAEQGERKLLVGRRLHGPLSADLLRNVAHAILELEAEFGESEGDRARGALRRSLSRVGTSSDLRFLEGCVSFNLAFASMERRQYAQVRRDAFRAIRCHPAFLANRGLLRVLLRSILHG
jgi:glycosyltransferase involved in cell wall biosynthesis